MYYKNYRVWQVAKEISVKIHKMTFDDLPGFEKFETGAQIRRSSKSTRSNIVEGFGRSRYKKEFIRFLIFALASNMETQDHLETLYDTNSLQNEKLYEELSDKIDHLGRMLNKFITSIEKTDRKEP